MDPLHHRAPLVAAGVVGAALVGLLAGLAVIEGGLFDIAASRPHGPLTYWVTRTTMARAVRREAAGIATPRTFTRDQVREGFRLYEANCVSCHGAPGVGQAPSAGGFMPPPPYLIGAAQEWRPSELYWIVRHGVKMTAMPAWDARLDRAQTWAVVAFLETLPHLNTEAYAQMRGELEPGSGTAARPDQASR